MSECPACGGALTAWRRVPSSEPALAGRRFELLRCRSCGSAVTTGTAPPALHESGAYRPGAPRLHRLALPLLRAFDRQRLGFLSGHVPSGARLLDVGAGRGRFVASALDAGFDASGIEPSQRGVDAAAALGAPVIRASIEEAAIEPASLDAVSVWHVLEHLDDPGAALSRLAGWLRPGGILLAGLPNLASLQARLGGERWYHLDVPRHRVHFTTTGFEALLTAHGFSRLAVHQVLAEHNPFGMWQSLVNRGTRCPSYLYNLLKRNAPADPRDLTITALAVPLAPVAALLELVAGWAGRGGTIAVVARREPSPGAG